MIINYVRIELILGQLLYLRVQFSPVFWKELSKCMAKPTIGAMKKLKKVVRYLKGTPRYVLKYLYQEKPEALSGWADTDFVGCQVTGKPTSGGIVMHGGHVIKSWSTNQAVVA